MKILCFLALTPTGADAASVHFGRGVGSARGLSPIRPMVGFGRGLSPNRPTVGSARNLSPIGGRVGEQTKLGPRRGPFRERSIAGGRFGYGDAGYGGLGYGGLGYGDLGLFGSPVRYGAGPYSAEPSDPGAAPLPVIYAPPPPCIHPQIIQIGRSVHVDRPAGQRPAVRVLYGSPPPCGSY